MSKQNRTKLFLDISTFVGFLIVMDPRASGLAVHEWLAVALVGALIVHLLLNWNWIAELTKRIFTKGLNGSRTNYILNWLLFIDGILIMLSGVMISEAVIPAFGLTLPVNMTWRGLHDISANLSLILMGLHLTLHWNWIVSTTKRLFGRNEAERPVTALAIEGKEVQA
ncbi:MAG: DUF4405 domain-containing protein [Chloroflexi bacterium]|nr:DUF4405 domain-containing protein [Chloroflexota bacterium]